MLLNRLFEHAQGLVGLFTEYSFGLKFLLSVLDVQFPSLAGASGVCRQKIAAFPLPSLTKILLLERVHSSHRITLLDVCLEIFIAVVKLLLSNGSFFHTHKEIRFGLRGSQRASLLCLWPCAVLEIPVLLLHELDLKLASTFT